MSLRTLIDGVKDPNNVIALAIALLFSHVLVTAIYNLYFHPLAKFPGPFLAKLSTIPSWYHTKNQDRHLWLLSLQEKYGALTLFQSTHTLSLSSVLSSHIDFLLRSRLSFPPYPPSGPQSPNHPKSPTYSFQHRYRPSPPLHYLIHYQAPHSATAPTLSP